MSKTINMHSGVGVPSLVGLKCTQCMGVCGTNLGSDNTGGISPWDVAIPHDFPSRFWSSARISLEEAEWGSMGKAKFEFHSYNAIIACHICPNGCLRGLGVH